MANPTIHRSFTVKSGNLCYGQLHNIWQGASVERTQGLPAVPPTVSGTVRTHKLNHNVPALNGTWNAFQLIDTNKARCTGWFVAHESVNVPQELDKILRVSGSPYEEDSGSSVNDERTAAEGILVINRYDWGWYDERGRDEVGTQGSHDEFDPATFVLREAAGLVDYEEAKAEVEFWKQQPPDSRDQEHRPHGLWMDIVNGEYKFGRFGFNEDHSAARSFLLFTIHTEFTHTVIAGMQQPLRKFETHEERFERRLREGYDFRGMKTLSTESNSAHKPAETQWLGPYAESERLFLTADIEAVLQQCANGRGPVDSWRQRVEVLLNEMFMSYLEKFIVPAGKSFDTVLAAAGASTPQRHKANTLDYYLYNLLTRPHCDPLTEWEIAAWDIHGVAERVRAFLLARSGEERDSLFEDNDAIFGLCRYLGIVLGQVLGIADEGSVDSYRNKIMPSEIRISIAIQEKYIALFRFSRVFWDGSE